MAGAPEGNNNASKGKEWRDAIRYALAKKGREVEGSDPAYTRGLRKVAEKFVEAAANGDPWAMRELGDRVDGKAVQGVEIGGPDGESIPVALNYIPVCQQSDK